MRCIPRVLLLSALCLTLLSACKKTAEVPETSEVVTIQLSLETGFPRKEDIAKVVIVLDAKDPRAQVVFRAGEPRSGAVGGFPIRWEYTDIDNDQGLEQVITVNGNPFGAHTFYMIHVLPEVTLAIPMKISVVAQDAQGNDIGWGFGCDNQGQEIYLGIRQIVGVALRAARRDPCPPCLHSACDAFGNCPFDFTCQGECCECKQPCSQDGGTCDADGGVGKTCVSGCCISGAKALGQDCTGPSDCASGFCKDGKCCNTACTTPCHHCGTGTCTKVLGAPDDPECQGASTCDPNGQCKRGLGEPCTGAVECASGICKDGKCCNTECTGLCHSCATGICLPVTGGEDVPECTGASTCDASGACKPKPGQECSEGSRCASGYCKDGVCCNEACADPCRRCNTGVCLTVSSGDDVPECAGSSTCGAGGACKKRNGEACSGAVECASGFCKDGRCCDTECSSPCHSCATGACLPVKNGPDDPECMGASACDALGICRKGNGQACTGDGQCSSGHCKDGKCCDSECTALCYSCATGTCQPVQGQEDYPECAGASTCDGSGSCKPKPGQACASGGECASGHCVDGVCCNEACADPCKSCLSGICSLVRSADDPMECTGASTCDASGACKLKNGQACESGGQCASGFCADGKCCDSACQAACQSCLTGTCATVRLADDAPQCTGDLTCDGSGLCKKQNGRACTGNGECASGHCKDGKCCNSECTAPCHSCASGTCSPVTGGDDLPECTGASTCDGSGACKPKPGQGCSAGSFCASGYCVDGVCCDQACADPCMSCLTGACTAVKGAEDPTGCSGAYTCDASGACKKKNGQGCTGAIECASGFCVDGKCCDTQCSSVCHSCASGSCLPIVNTEDSSGCSGSKICDAAGACKLKNGQPCTGAAGCASGFCKDGKCCDTECTTPCHSCATGACSVVEGREDYPECAGTNRCDGQGVCLKREGQGCTSGGECASGHCADGRCCDQACAGECRSCLGGACLTVTLADDPDSCSGDKTCSASGACKLKNGQGCTGATVCASGFCKDGKCCDTECTTACRDCSTGACLPVSGAEDTDSCATTHICNAAGECKKLGGQGCTRPEECLQGFCEGGKCCNRACPALCHSCDTGTCLQLSPGTEDSPDCQHPKACDLNGACKLKNGESCTGGIQCLSGICVDGKCCDTECTTACHSCISGTCSPVKGLDDYPECIDRYTCSASGACLLRQGQDCSGSSQCATGFCVDGKCCDTECTTTCRSCTSGTCTPLAGEDDPPGCTGANTCGGGGVCKLKNGQDCTLGGAEACASLHCVDGKCCDRACAGECQSCASGTCAAVQGAEDGDTCSGTKICSAAGLCKLKNGQGCLDPVECASGHCKDGKCCNSACSLPCFNCATGTCNPVSANTADPPECLGAYSCSAGGACLLAYGQDCSGSSQCASGFCADGKCCDTACSALCYSCATGNCTPVPLGGEDYPVCTGDRACSAGGECKLKNGQDCTEGTACASGFCVDGRCCDTECTENCYGCETGTCQPVAYGEQDSPGCVDSKVCRIGQCLPRHARLSAQSFSTCAVMPNGTLACWGWNAQGQLGDGTTTDRHRPTVTCVSPRALDVSVGLTHGCALLEDRSIACWGWNYYGQLGDDSTTDRLAPVAVSGIDTAVSLSLGAAHSCALLDDGRVKCWGLNDRGQLGTGNTTNRDIPYAVQEISTAVALSAGDHHSCALLQDRTVHCWGQNDKGQLGDGSTITRTRPVAIPGLTGVVALSAGSNHSCALLESKQIKCWGANGTGQIGDNTLLDRRAPVLVHGISTAVALSAGNGYTCALLEDRSLRCWGRNDYGQLGDGTTENRRAPVPVSGISTAVAVSAGALHTCVYHSNNVIQCWGRNNYGQLGDNSTTDRLTPSGSVTTLKPDQITAFNDQTCVKLGNVLRCWGGNGTGQLGDGTTDHRNLPVSVQGVSDAAQVSMGLDHACLRTTSGRVWCWGRGYYGQLGNNSNNDSSVPVQVQGITTAVDVSAGQYHSCAVLSDRSIKCWGRNGAGQLGDKTTTNRSTPVTVHNINNALDVAAGYGYTCAIVDVPSISYDNVKCWGVNNHGQLGNGTFTSSLVPVSVSPLTRAATLSAGPSHACATRTAYSSPKCWGENNYGQLGNNSTADSNVPVTLSLSYITMITAGKEHTCAVKRLNPRYIFCWGRNDKGQLGDGTIEDRHTPVTVYNLTGASDIAAGEMHTCALMDNGSIRCWGNNTYGQLGNGTNTSSLIPVPTLCLE